MDAETVVSAARGWIGTPYVHQASRRGAGADCLGLVRGVWRTLHGADDDPEPVPPYAPLAARGDSGETLRDAAARWLNPVPLAELAAGDVALFRMSPHAPAHHCGIVAARDGARTLIHAWQGHAVAEVPFLPWWRRRLAYAFRFR